MGTKKCNFCQKAKSYSHFELRRGHRLKTCTPCRLAQSIQRKAKAEQDRIANRIAERKAASVVIKEARRVFVDYGPNRAIGVLTRGKMHSSANQTLFLNKHFDKYKKVLSDKDREYDRIEGMVI